MFSFSNVDEAICASIKLSSNDSISVRVFLGIFLRVVVAANVPFDISSTTVSQYSARKSEIISLISVSLARYFKRMTSIIFPSYILIIAVTYRHSIVLIFITFHVTCSLIITFCFSVYLLIHVYTSLSCAAYS